MAIKRIGAVRTNAFIYLVPLITMASSALILSGVYGFPKLSSKCEN